MTKYTINADGPSVAIESTDVSPIFFLLLIVAGLLLGFVDFFLLPDVAHAVGG